MARFYIPPSALHGTSFILSGTEAHHALHVLRKKVGDEIDLFDGKDLSFRGRIDRVQVGEIHGTLLQDLPNKSLSIQLTLFQALSRGPKWEWLLEKACEVGVSRIVPVFTQRSLIKLDAAQSQEKLKRWNRIALSASKQSGRTDLMSVDLPASFVAALDQLDKTHLSLIPWEKENDQTIRAASAGYTGKAVNVFIGPEGGWEAREVELALKVGVKPVRLGPTLLRTETAGMVAAALVLREFGVY